MSFFLNNSLVTMKELKVFVGNIKQFQLIYKILDYYVSNKDISIILNSSIIITHCVNYCLYIPYIGF